MAKLLFVCAPLPGHLDWGGFLATAQAAQEMGHTVRWVSGERIWGMVEAARLDFRPVPHTGWRWPPPPMPEGVSPGEAATLRFSRALDTWLDEELVREAVPPIVEAAREFEPDVIASDPFLASVAIAAEVVGVPLAICGWPAMPPREPHSLLPVQAGLGQDALARIGRLSGNFGVEGVNWGGGTAPTIQSPRLHVSYFSWHWHQGEPAFLPQTEFVGGKIRPPAGPRPDWLDDLPRDAPAIFITLGSVFTGDLDFFALAAQAAAANGAVPIVVLGGNPIPDEDMVALKSALPGGTRLLRWVDYDHVLPCCSLIIHHGGMGTTHAAIVHGLPQIVVPHAADQRGQAQRVARAKVGLNLSVRDVRNGQLRVGVKALLADERVARYVADLRDDFAALGGPSRAVDLLLELA
jgi:UDP:flavonoid glycosyltransferase YjiC (YdhE family)